MLLRRSLPLTAVALAAALSLVYACSSSSTGKDEGGSIDKDGDGIADDLGTAVDANKDGKPDPFKTGVAVDTNGDGKPDAAGLDTNKDGIIDALDTNFDGKPDVSTALTGTTSGTGGTDGGLRLPDSSVGTGAKPGNGTPETCDGKDNDGNGLIDDVDVGGDGICDCLNIGTIGTIGPWSTGGDIFKTWLKARSPIGVVSLGDGVLTKEKLAGLDVIVVLRTDTAALQDDPPHHAFSAAEVKVFSDWVKAGGGVMTTIGYNSDETAEVVNVNTLLAPFAVGYVNNDNVQGLVDKWEKHPIAEGILKINTDNGVPIKPSDATLVATTPNGVTAMVTKTVASGRVIVWADEWITYDSEWQDTADQQVERLWLNIFKWLTPGKRCQVPVPPRLLK